MMYRVGDKCDIWAIEHSRWLTGTVERLPGFYLEYPDKYGIRVTLDSPVSPGSLYSCSDYQIRPHRRECDTIVSWDSCAWRPQHLRK